MPLNYSVFDCHCDTVTLRNLFHTNTQLKKRDIKRFKRYIQVFAICPENSYAYSHAVYHIKRYKRLLRLWGLSPITDANTLKNAGFGAILSLEGADALCTNLAALDMFYKKGVRLLTITWNNNNAAGFSITSEKGGITPFGKKLIKKCEQKNILIDLSHLSDEGFYDVCAAAQKPFICSHSNSRHICNNSRNITDDMFKELIKINGAVGINFFPDFLGGSGSMKDILRHIDYFCSLGGEKNIGIGSDFDGIRIMPEGCHSAKFIYDIAENLLRLNYSEKCVSGILFDNFFRIFENCLSGGSIDEADYS